MDWGDIVYAITNNAVWCGILFQFITYIFQAAKSTSNPGIHGTSGVPITKPHGVMFGIGWHLSQEPRKTLVTYAPSKKDDETLAMYVINFVHLYCAMI
jgi:hypothetical protein